MSALQALEILETRVLSDLKYLGMRYRLSQSEIVALRYLCIILGPTSTVKRLNAFKLNAIELHLGLGAASG